MYSTQNFCLYLTVITTKLDFNTENTLLLLNVPTTTVKLGSFIYIALISSMHQRIGIVVEKRGSSPVALCLVSEKHLLGLYEKRCLVRTNKLLGTTDDFSGTKS